MNDYSALLLRYNTLSKAYDLQMETINKLQQQVRAVIEDKYHVVCRRCDGT